MGNCCARHPSTVDWSGDDWGSMGRGIRVRPDPLDDEIRELLRPRPGKEVKVKISKKELESLLRKAEGSRGGVFRRRSSTLPAVKVLFDKIVNHSISVEVKNQHRASSTNWRPELYSIPEVIDADDIDDQE